MLVSVQLLSRFNSLQPYGLRHSGFLSISNTEACSKLCLSVGRCNPRVSYHRPLLCLQSFQAQDFPETKLALLNGVARGYLELQLQHQSSNIILRTDFITRMTRLDLAMIQGLSRLSFSSKESNLWH